MSPLRGRRLAALVGAALALPWLALAQERAPEAEAGPAAPASRARAMHGRSFVLRVDRAYLAEGWRRDVAIEVREGRIAAIRSRGEPSPPDLRVVDRSGRVAVPGFVLADAGPELRVQDGPHSDEAASARHRAIDAFDPFREEHALLAQGITTAFIHPGRGRLVNGDGAVVKVGGRPEERVLRAQAELCIDFGPGALSPPLKIDVKVPSSSDVPIDPGERQRPASRLGLVPALVERLEAARAYAAARARGGKERPAVDLDLEAIHAALEGGRLRVEADRRDDLLALVRAMRRLGLKPVVVGAAEAHALLEDLVQLGGPVVYREPRRLSGPLQDQGEDPERMRVRDDTPAALARAKLRLAIVPQQGEFARLRLAAALAVRGGLSRDQALRAITSGAAAVLGVGDRVGTLAVGRDADFVLLNDDPLTTQADVVETWVAGRRAYRAPGSDAVVVRAGTIITRAGEAPIRDGALLIQEGRIVAVGREVPQPRGARVIDAGRRAVVTPGFIDGLGRLGLQGTQAQGPEQHRAIAHATPAFRRVARAGVTTVVLGPPPGQSPGRLAAIKTHESRPPEEDLRRGLILREVCGATFDLRGWDPAQPPMMLLQQLTAAKAYDDQWLKYEQDRRAYQAQQEKKAEQERAERRKKVRQRKAADAKPEAPKDQKPEEKKPDQPADKPPEPLKPKFDPISGTWEFTLSGGPMGSREQKGRLLLKLEADGKTIAGVAKPPEEMPGEDIQLKGSLEGKQVTIELIPPAGRPSPMGNPKIEATLTGEDSMEGNVKIGPFTVNFSAKRLERGVPEIKVTVSRRRKKAEGPEPPRPQPQLEGLRAVLKGRGALVIAVQNPRVALSVLELLQPKKPAAERPADPQAAAAWAQETANYKLLAGRELRVTFVAFQDVDQVAAELRGAGVGLLVHPAAQVARERRTVSAPVELEALGLRLAFMSEAGDGAADLPLRALGTVGEGLSPTRALAALTHEAARLLAIEDVVGTLEVGKDGDLCIFDGPPFEATSRLRTVLVRGRVVPEEDDR